MAEPRLIHGRPLEVAYFEAYLPSLRDGAIECKADVLEELVTAIRRGMIVRLFAVSPEGERHEVRA